MIISTRVPLSSSPKNILFSTLLIVSLLASLFGQAYGADSTAAAPAPVAVASSGGSDVSADPAVIDQGKALFSNNCTQCHAISDEVVVGPGLKNVHKRQAMPWLIKWIKNSTAVVNSGDPHAVEIFNKFNKVQMQSFDFKDEEIKSIVAYIASESDKAAAPAATSAVVTDPNAASASAAAPVDSSSLNYVLALFVIILVLILIILIVVISILTKYLNKENLNEQESELITPNFSFLEIFKSKGFKIVATLCFVLFATKSCIDGIMGIGIAQGYAPTQPIAFSHKLHAGNYKIDCGYCHTGAYKSKSANIPSVNICMNCHNAIKQESPEIQRLYKAIQNNRPIEWVRVHNLPDLAYFNHSQHTKVGGIECQTCHGPIQEMEVVQQYAPLTMGWCINCHRETSVNGKDNQYYNKLMAQHNKSSKEPMKVKDIGGLECSKCHY